MRKSLFISLFMLAIGSFPAVQAQHEPAPPDAAALMAAYEVLRDTADNGQKLEHLFRAEEALAANTPAGVRWALHRELATVLYDLGAYDLAFQQMRLELEAAQANADTVSIARAVSAIGSRMMEQQQLDSALHYLAWSLRLAPRDDAYTLSGLYNNMAILHLNRREPDIADRYLDTVATLLGTTVPEFVDIRFSLRDNRADAALLNGDSARARALVAENLSVLLRYLDRDPDVQGRFVRYSIKLVSMWLAVGNTRQAGAVSDTLRVHLQDLSEGMQREARIQLVRLDHQLAVAVGDPLREARASGKLLALEDSLARAGQAERKGYLGSITAFGVRRMQRELAALAALDEARVSAAETRTRNRTIILWLVVALSLTGLAAVAGFYRARVRKKQLEKQQVEAELAYKRKDLQQMAQDLSRKQQWTREVLDAAGEIVRAKPQKAEVASKVEDLKESVRSQLRVDEQREWLYREVEMVNSAFYDRLRDRHPDLTDKELELCGMVRSGLNNTTIAELRHIAPTSARVAKYRLKQKLGLREEDDLSKELASI